ncbi:tetratricopeptide repeat protein [Mycobacterium sp. URHB0044]|uniref:tetratricopeptide repeat protein n=1 Tax=Mycobacterium sp. URHB0044 TaxID=1380386 RepID=UPI00048D897C|nr:tetratricopeptide repeat protein [Mycobacterium sp. URHB0044]
MTAAGSPAGDVDGAVALAGAYLDARNYARAHQVLRDALTGSPNSAVLLGQLARVQVLTRDYASAARSAYAALAIAPEDGFAMRIYAIALDGCGWLDDALWMAWRVATTYPDDRLTHFVYADLLLKAAQPQAALYVVGESLRLDPANADSHVLRGQILARLRRFDESTASYEEALRLDPGNASAVHNIAVNGLARSQWSSALRGFLGAARLDPELADLARRNIGTALAKSLRLATFGVVVLAFVAIGTVESTDPGSSTVEARVAAAVFTVALLAGLVWMCRIVPLRTWRSVLRIKPVLVLRLGLVVAAIPVGALATFGMADVVVAVAAPMLLLAGILVALIGRITGA